MTTSTMRAARFHDYGPPEVLVIDEVPRPTAGPGQVLIKVHAAGVNPIDWKFRSGAVREFAPLPLPHTPGVDVAGVVEAVGPDVTDIVAGEAVFGRGAGAYAEYAIAAVDAIAPKPASLSFTEAATVPVGAGTAWAMLFEAAEVAMGQRILVHGAAGGVGMFAVQLARWKDVHVIGTASARNRDFVRSLGAERVVDYTSTRFEDEVHDVDAVLDTVGGDLPLRSLQVLRPGGILVEIAAQVPEQEATKRGLRAAFVNAQGSREMLEMVAVLIDAGTIHTEVGRAFPLSDVAQAHALSETRHGRGRIVIEVVPAS